MSVVMQKFAVNRACAPCPEGDTWLQPPGIPHNITAFSADLEVLEIVSPGVFDTHEA